MTINEKFPKIMVMECGHSQAWGDNSGGDPVAGEKAFCVWCQKMELIKKIY